MGGSSDALRPLIVVQARTGSQRLPGKVLADLCGRPLLAWLLERVARSSSTSGMVVATTTDAADDSIAALARGSGADVVRGHRTDVLTRFVTVLDETDAAAIVRISADSPFLDGNAVDTVVAAFTEDGAELVENHRTAGWPYGTAVEVVTADCLRRIDAETADPAIREHVTLHAYAHPNRFRARHVAPPPELEAPALRLAVDTAEDLERVRRIWAALELDGDFGLADVVARFRDAAPA